jgi:hypothetical protein
MRVYYTFQDSNERPFPDHSKRQTWSNEFPEFATIGDMKDRLGLWHSLDPSSLTMFDSFQSCKPEEEGDFTGFGSCVEFPLIVSVRVNEGESQEPMPVITSSKLPINRVLQYLVTREKKYKPIVYLT